MEKNREKFLDDYCSQESGYVTPKFGIYDRGLNSRLAEKKDNGLYDKIVKYAKRLVVSAVLAAGVLMPSYACNAALAAVQEPAKRGTMERTAERKYSSAYFNYVKGAFDKKYDNHNNFHNDSLDEILSTTHKIYKHITFEVTRFDYSGKEPKSEKGLATYTGCGSAVAVKNENGRLTLLTCNHVVSAPQMEDKYDAQGRPLLKFRLKEENYVLEQADIFLPIIAVPLIGMKRISYGPMLKVVARDRQHDAALVQTHIKDAEIIKGYKTVETIGNSEELEPGDFLYAVGHPNNLTKIVTSGHVGARSNPYTRADDAIFYADMTINPGNSGGPVYALRDGKPELVGIAGCKWPEGLGGVVRINYLKQLLRRARIGGKDEKH